MSCLIGSALVVSFTKTKCKDESGVATEINEMFEQLRVPCCGSDDRGVVMFNSTGFYYGCNAILSPNLDRRQFTPHQMHMRPIWWFNYNWLGR